MSSARETVPQAPDPACTPGLRPTAPADSHTGVVTSGRWGTTWLYWEGTHASLFRVSPGLPMRLFPSFPVARFAASSQVIALRPSVH